MIQRFLARFSRGALQGSVVPEQAIAGRALMLVIAIMTLLAGLTVGAVVVVQEAASAWQSDIGREVTVEIRPVAGVDQAAEIERAVALAQEFPGVGRVRALSDAETERLLAPWLGAGVDLDALPVPRLIVIEISDPQAIDIGRIREEITDTIRGATLDDHDQWIDRLSTMAQTMVVVGLAVLGLVLAAMVMSVVFATRAAMAGNREIIEVLHFVGAEDRFVAAEFERHFLILGFKGGLAGGGLALIAFLLLDLMTRTGAPSAGMDVFTGGLAVGLYGYAGVALIVFAVALLTAGTSRLAVHSYLAGIEDPSP